MDEHGPNLVVRSNARSSASSRSASAAGTALLRVLTVGMHAGGFFTYSLTLGDSEHSHTGVVLALGYSEYPWPIGETAGGSA